MNPRPDTYAIFRSKRKKMKNKHDIKVLYKKRNPVVYQFPPYAVMEMVGVGDWAMLLIGLGVRLSSPELLFSLGMALLLALLSLSPVSATPS